MLFTPSLCRMLLQRELQTRESTWTRFASVAVYRAKGVVSWLWSRVVARLASFACTIFSVSNLYWC